jgi:lipoyl(octanoyl) transferase
MYDLDNQNLARQSAGFHAVRPGRLSYDQGLRLQEELLQLRSESAADYLILLEHQPVITLGRGSSETHLLASAEQLASQGIVVHRISRGGDITFHGPGQLVGYPIVHLPPDQRDLHRYLRKLEQLLLGCAASFGVAAETLPGKTGLWAGRKKLASIGVGVRRWTTWHGFALNVEQRLEGFANIVPCGLQGVAMTSLAACLNRNITVAEVETEIIHQFAEVFSADYLGEYEPPTTS